MNEQDAQILERATHTIVAQVDAMKQMVNAFSEYARAPDMHVSRFDLNQLVTEVVDLYRVQASGVDLKLVLEPRGGSARWYLRIACASGRFSTIYGHQLAGGARG